jgi:putative oxidoreductase
MSEFRQEGARVGSREVDMNERTVDRSDLRDWALTLLRVVTGLLFMQHGWQKLFGWLGSKPVETVASLMGVAGVLETVGGALILLGLFTRPVAFVLAGEMAVAYFLMHLPNGGFWPLQNRGEPAVLFCFIFLFFAAWGAGPLSLDARRRPELTV